MKKNCQYSVAVAFAFALTGPLSFADDAPDIPSSASKTDPKEFMTLVSPNKEFSVSVSRSGHIRIYSCDNQLLWTFYQCNPIAAAISNDGKLLCSSGEFEGRGTLNVWHIDDGKFLCTIKTPMETTPTLAFSGDGALLAASVGKTRLNIWEIPSGRFKWSASFSRPISALSFSPSNAAVIITCSDKGVRHLSSVDGAAFRDSNEEK